MRVENRIFLMFLGIMFILVMSLNSVLFRLSKSLFAFELIIFLFILFLGVYLLINLHLEKEFVYKYLFIFFTINVLNVIFIYFIRLDVKEIILPVAMALIGLFISVNKIPKKGIVEENLEVEEDTSPAVFRTYSPGVYVASKQGTTFHSAKCDWAEKINEKNQVWFNDKEEAENQGFKPCSCVK